MTERREAIREARQERRDEWHMRDPTNAEFLLGALQIQDDVSWYNFRDAAVRQGYSSFESDYQDLCESLGFGSSGAVGGTSPVRLHNVGEQNQWGYTAGNPDYFVPGIPCTFNLVWSGWMFQAQLEALNDCVPLETVLVAGGAVKETLRAVFDALKGKRSKA